MGEVARLRLHRGHGGTLTPYTHGHAEAVLRSHRWRTAANSAAHLVPHLHDGQRLLDVGSGPGTITADLARLVGEVVALEVTDDAAELTRAELDRRGVANATVVVGDVHALDLPTDSFDVVHAHQVLQHVTDPVGALREMVRVARPGGVVSVRESDYGHFSWHPASRGLDRWLELYDAAARANGGEPNAGRMLLAWAHAAGADDVAAGSSTWCYADPADRAWWGNLWADRITGTALGRQLVASGAATGDELAAVAEAWRTWATDPDGWFSVLHGEVLVRIS